VVTAINCQVSIPPPVSTACYSPLPPTLSVTATPFVPRPVAQETLNESSLSIQVDIFIPRVGQSNLVVAAIINHRSIVNKIYLLDLSIKTKKCAILFLSETWLDSSIINNYLCQEGF